MKAWTVSNVRDDDLGQVVIWADNVREAKKKALSTDMFIDYDDFIYLRVKRAKEFDDMENLPQKELMIQQWLNGWWFDERDFVPFDHLKEEERDVWWEMWYNKHFKGDEE